MSSAAKPQTSEILQSLPTEAILAVGIADGDEEGDEEDVEEDDEEDVEEDDEDDEERPPFCVLTL